MESASAAEILLQLDEAESLICLMLMLWRAEASHRVRARIPDSVLFRHGCAMRWLFTSAATHEILKKRSDRILTPSYIAQTFRGKSMGRDVAARAMIAVLWYLCLEGRRPRLQRALVDEKEFLRILSAQPVELLLAQANIFGDELIVEEIALSASTNEASHPLSQLFEQLTLPYADINIHHVDLMLGRPWGSDGRAVLAARAITLRIPVQAHDTAKATLMADLDAWIAPIGGILSQPTIDKILAGRVKAATGISRPRTADSTSSSSNSAIRFTDPSYVLL